MSLTLTWADIAVRLALTLLAGSLIGINRGGRGKPAGLRTTLLVCLSASLTMIMVNWLMGTRGRAGDSFVDMDMMRLPLGLLTGMGFIGAGAIVKKGPSVQGVTTAATLWFSTIIGLALGSGLLALGMVGLGLALVVLAGFGVMEGWLPQMRDGRLTVVLAAGGQLTVEGLRQRLDHAGVQVKAISFRAAGQVVQRVEVRVRWKAAGNGPTAPRIVEELAAAEGVERLAWRT